MEISESSVSQSPTLLIQKLCKHGKTTRVLFCFNTDHSMLYTLLSFVFFITKPIMPVPTDKIVFTITKVVQPVLVFVFVLLFK